MGEKSPLRGWMGGGGVERKEENDVNEMARKRDRQIIEGGDREGRVLLPHGFQGLPLPGGAVARQDYNDGEIIMRALIKWLIIS